MDVGGRVGSNVDALAAGDGPVLDAVDRQLLADLALNARASNKELAAHVGVAPSTCSLRMRRLRDLGVIRGFHADIDPRALGRPIQALVAVRVQPAARAHIGALTSKLSSLPGVTNVFFLAGPVDFHIQVAVASSDDLRDFVTEHLSASREFASTETSLIFEHRRIDRLT
ncbi:Lrp/AsnC family transcriptional regulator [Nocardioides taihuensis]|uniref:Lrp/AsnC family transcriptional regulator n=1 Tax=Nocardioides taihuensis TaxID=1835606 RepID=A0ABW0BEC1_9ACTN